MKALRIKIILLSILLLSTTLFANIAKIVAFKGNAIIIRENKTINIKSNSFIFKNDTIITKNHTKIQILFKDETIVSIGKNSSFKVADYLFDDKNNKYKAEFNMLQGAFRTITGKIGKYAPNKFNLKTKSASIGIRGTQIIMNLTPTLEEIFCTEGKIFIQKFDSDISSIVNAGEFVSIKPDEYLEKIIIKKIRNKDIEEINKKIIIKKNFATDNISLNVKEEETIKNNKIKKTSNNIRNKTADKVKDKDDELKQKDDIKIDEKNSIEDTKHFNDKNDDIKQKDDELKQKDDIQIDEKNTIEDSKHFNDKDDYLKQQDNIQIDEITPKSYLEEFKSLGRYKGSFNNYSYDSKNQYIKFTKDEKIKIPEDTSISMDIDFGAIQNQILNGKIETNSTSEILTFDGDINKGDSSFNIKATGSTNGSITNGSFYGSKANKIKGNIDLKSNNTDLEIKGNFDANKQ
ncbi:MAG: hypothetical protein GY932_12555 [Arcobacter sp.]|nr:hypothetical protein [Arcobacter sp.]